MYRDRRSRRGPVPTGPKTLAAGPSNRKARRQKATPRGHTNTPKSYPSHSEATLFRQITIALAEVSISIPPNDAHFFG